MFTILGKRFVRKIDFRRFISWVSRKFFWKTPFPGEAIEINVKIPLRPSPEGTSYNYLTTFLFSLFSMKESIGGLEIYET